MFHNIYALCDRDLLQKFSLEFEDFINIAKLFGCEMIQYRDKHASLDEKQENLKKLRRLWDGLLIVNDEIALARLCDGVHMGQEDLKNLIGNFGAKSKVEGVAIVRKLSGAKIIGISTHNEAEIEEANGLDIEYIGLGAYRASSTKDVSSILGNRLSELAKNSRHKVVAIGGVRVFDAIEHVWKKAIGTDLIVKALTYA